MPSLSAQVVCRSFHVNTGDDALPLLKLLSARSDPDRSVEPAVREILADVARRKDEALVDYTRRFDCPDFAVSRIRVLPQEINAALNAVSREDQEAISLAAENIRAFHVEQKERSFFQSRPDGSVLGQMVLPVDRAGLYVPGGRSGETPLISSLLMNAIPALVAGVGEIAVLSPPRKDGSLNPHILAASRLLGLEEVYRAGSAWAIAALAYGTPTIPRVDLIAGPGNLHVATAKRLLQGTVGIDMVAGPSEVLVLADDSAKPAWIAADMLSQAEHDPLAAAVCITDSEQTAAAVLMELARQMETLPRSAIARQSLKDWGALVIVPDLSQGIAMANRIAPEHLELCVEDAWTLLGSVRHAGAVFLGAWSPEALGDYAAGPNHVLPTLGAARFSSGLSVHTFCRRINLIAASPAFTAKTTAAVARLARLEGLEAHARAIEIRRQQYESVCK